MHGRLISTGRFHGNRSSSMFKLEQFLIRQFSIHNGYLTGHYKSFDMISFIIVLRFLKSV